MAVTFVGAETTVQAPNLSNSITGTEPAGTDAGDVVFLFAHADTTNANSWNPPNDFTEIEDHERTLGGGTHILWAGWKVHNGTSGDGYTIAQGPSTSQPAMSVTVVTVRNVDTTYPLSPAYSRTTHWEEIANTPNNSAPPIGVARDGSLAMAWYVGGGDIYNSMGAPTNMTMGSSDRGAQRNIAFAYAAADAGVFTPADWTHSVQFGTEDHFQLTLAVQSASQNAVTMLDNFVCEQAVSNPSDYPVSAGSNRYLIYACAMVGDNDTQDSVTYGGQPMTLLFDPGETPNGNVRTYYWGLDNAGIAAASGSNFVGTYSGSPATNRRVHAVGSFVNVDQTTPIGDSDHTAAGLVPNPTSVSLTNKDGAYAIAVARSAQTPDNTFTWSDDFFKEYDGTVNSLNSPPDLAANDGSVATKGLNTDVGTQTVTVAIGSADWITLSAIRLDPVPVAPTADIIRSVEYVTIDWDAASEPVTKLLSKSQDYTQCVPFFSKQLVSGSLTDDWRQRTMKVEMINSAGTPAVRVSATGKSAADDHRVKVFVVEFTSDITVQQLDADMLNGFLTTNVAVADVFDQSRAFMMLSYSYNHTAGNDTADDAYVRPVWNGASTTSVTLQRSNSVGSIDGMLYVVSCANNEFSVQHRDIAIPALSETVNDTISSVDMARTFVLNHYKSDEVNDSPLDSSFVADLTSSTNVRVRRSIAAEANATASVAVQVVECASTQWTVTRGDYVTTATNPATITLASGVNQVASLVKSNVHCAGLNALGTSDLNTGTNIDTIAAAVSFQDSGTLVWHRSSTAIETGNIIPYEVISFKLDRLSTIIRVPTGPLR